MAKKRTKTIDPTINKKILEYLSAVKKKTPIQQAYLFGSWAKKTNHSESDIDLAIVSLTFITWDKTITTLAQAMKQDWSPIEPHGFHPKEFSDTSNPLVAEILAHGIRIL